MKVQEECQSTLFSMEYDEISRDIHKADLGENLKTKTEFPWTLNPEVEMDASWNKN